MNQSAIYEVIFKAIDMVNNIREKDQQMPKASGTLLYAKDGYLDSMGLVGFLIDIEELFLDEDIHIALSDEKAMSQNNSPFKSVQTLAEYIQSLLKE